MSKLPQVKPRQIQRVLLKQGFILKRSVGSHFRYHHPDGRRVSVAFHNQPLRKGTLKSILHQAKLSLDDFLKLL